jgi:TolA-binding protein
VLSSACFATRNDVRILQEDVLSLRTMQMRSDSARARQLSEISSTLNTTLVALRDSVRELGLRLVTFQGTTRQELYSLGDRLIQLGELMGANAQAMRSFRADLEERNRQTMEQAIRTAVPPGAPGDTANRAAPPPVRMTEGPNVLYQIGRDQLSGNAWTAARDAFKELIRLHPASDLVPDAMLGIADAFEAERNHAESDSVYRDIVAKFPNDEMAPRAMYKLGLSLARQQKKVEARTTMQEVVRKFPRSDESTLASDWLARNPPF